MDIPRAFRRPSLLIKPGIAEEKPQKGLYVHAVIPSILLHWTLSHSPTSKVPAFCHCRDPGAGLLTKAMIVLRSVSVKHLLRPGRGQSPYLKFGSTLTRLA